MAVAAAAWADQVKPAAHLMPSASRRWRSMAEWRADGFQPLNGRWPDGQIQATLLEPDGPGKTAYLLTGNYRAILDYNCSNFYALSVGLLADEIDR